MLTPFEIEFALGRNIRYCGKQVRFFESGHRISMLSTSIAGSAAFVTVLSDFKVASAILAGLIAIISSIDGVFEYSEKARNYNDLRNRLYDLYCTLVSYTEDEKSKDILIFKEKLTRIERDMPPRNRVLDVICRNEEEISHGFPKEQTYHVSWWRRMLVPILDCPPSEWIQVEDKRPGAASKAEVDPNLDPKTV